MTSKTLVKLGAVVVLLIFAAIPSWAEELSGKGVSVHDGDMMTLLVDKAQTKVRLAGIDAPELKQAFGTKAKQALSELAFGKTVKVTESGKDRYGRTIGEVYAGAKWVNLALVERSMAWVYLAYSLSTDTRPDGIPGFQAATRDN